jgi:hypothetical protein
VIWAAKRRQDLTDGAGQNLKVQPASFKQRRAKELRGFWLSYDFF